MSESVRDNVTLPPDLQASLRSYAEKNGRSVQDVAEEAVRTFLDDEEMTDVRRYHTRKAESMGLRSDDYAVYLVKEYRREKRAQQTASACESYSIQTSASPR